MASNGGTTMTDVIDRMTETDARPVPTESQHPLVPVAGEPRPVFVDLTGRRRRGCAADRRPCRHRVHRLRRRRRDDLVGRTDRRRLGHRAGDDHGRPDRRLRAAPRRAPRSSSTCGRCVPRADHPRGAPSAPRSRRRSRARRRPYDPAGSVVAAPPRRSSRPSPNIAPPAAAPSRSPDVSRGAVDAPGARRSRSRPDAAATVSPTRRRRPRGARRFGRREPGVAD